MKKLVFVLWLLFDGVYSASAQVNPASPEKQCVDGLCTTSYSPEFFIQYGPLTALDMVNRLPSFSLSDTDESQRGFAENAGNVLFNNERVSTKSQTLSNLLEQIPTKNIVRIDVLSGKLGKFALPGQSIVANVISRNDSSNGIWDVRGRFLSPDYHLRQAANIVYNTHIDSVSVKASLFHGRYRGRSESERLFFNAPEFDKVGERRMDIFDESGWETDGALALNTDFGGWKINVNLGFLHLDEYGGADSMRSHVQMNNEQTRFFFSDDDVITDTNFSFDLEKSLTPTDTLKVIGIMTNNEYDEIGGVINTSDASDSVLERERTFNTLQQERIARLEWNNTRIQGHHLKLSLENAINKLDSRFSLAALENGQLAQVAVPGADTIVKENRLDLRLLDSFSIGPVGVEAGVAVEQSTIEQQGDISEERDFRYFKPSISFSYKTKDSASLRFDLRRTISQLDFFDFASYADLDQDELELGNPTLEPEKTYRFEFQYERQFAALKAINIKVFYDDVTDALDTLILSDTLEAFGNIGDAYRFGIDAAFTLPTEFLHISNGRLDVELDWQETQVTDPLSGEHRELGDSEHWQLLTNFRQELPKLDAAWGIRYLVDDDRFFFGADEVSRFGRSKRFDIFYEQRLKNGFRISTRFENIFEDEEPYERLVFNGNRSNGSLAQREFRNVTFPRQVFIQVSKSFTL